MSPDGIPVLLLFLLSLFVTSYAVRALIFLVYAYKAIKHLPRTISLPKQSTPVHFLLDSKNLANVPALEQMSKIDLKGNDNTQYTYKYNQKKIISCNLSINTAKTNKIEDIPFISILVATYNENRTISRLLSCLSGLKYPCDRYEIIIIDDSDDGTFDIISKVSRDIPNLKAVHRDKRDGWKGGALNLGLDIMDTRSLYVMILDADSVIFDNTLERFVCRFLEARAIDSSVVAIQGFPICQENFTYHKSDSWVARGIDFRLAQRNMVEFLAKNEMRLPVQITGNLFMIEADTIKKLRFSNDLCEDWDLTLDLYCKYNRSNNNNSNNNSKKARVIFDPGLISYCEAPVSLKSYFKQRLRVSEGHTRGFRKKIRPLFDNKNLSLIEKIEMVFTGLQYAKFIPIFIMTIIDAVFLLSLFTNYYPGSTSYDIISNNYWWKMSILMQGGGFAAMLFSNVIAIEICSNIRNYRISDIVKLLILNIITSLAFVSGSFLGLLRNKGLFYKTQRNTLKTTS